MTRPIREEPVRAECMGCGTPLAVVHQTCGSWAVMRRCSCPWLPGRDRWARLPGVVTHGKPDPVELVRAW